MLRATTITSSIICCLIAWTSAAAVEDSNTDRIINGIQTNIQDYAYTVSLQRQGIHFCGGSLLNNRWILTAAHCLEKYHADQASLINVMLGATDWRKDGVVKGVEKFYIHPKYEGKAMLNDIAVVKLSSDVIFSSKIKPVEMASVEPSDGAPCVVTGWGYTNSKVPRLENVLRSTTVFFRPNKVCGSPSYQYATSLKESMVCGEGVGTDACQGDSGGPLVDEETGKQVGIVSWGYDCAKEGYPGIYTNVAELRPWVMSHLYEW